MYLKKNEQIRGLHKTNPKIFTDLVNYWMNKSLDAFEHNDGNYLLETILLPLEDENNYKTSSEYLSLKNVQTVAKAAMCLYANTAKMYIEKQKHTVDFNKLKQNVIEELEVYNEEEKKRGHRPLKLEDYNYFSGQLEMINKIEKLIEEE